MLGGACVHRSRSCPLDDVEGFGFREEIRHLATTDADRNIRHRGKGHLSVAVQEVYIRCRRRGCDILPGGPIDHDELNRIDRRRIVAQAPLYRDLAAGAARQCRWTMVDQGPANRAVYVEPAIRLAQPSKFRDEIGGCDQMVAQQGRGPGNLRCCPGGLDGEEQGGGVRGPRAVGGWGSGIGPALPRRRGDPGGRVPRMARPSRGGRADRRAAPGPTAGRSSASPCAFRKP